MTQGGKIFVGPAGWSYPDWRETVFGGIDIKVDALEFISRYFDTIEINSTFYRIPSERTVRSWTERVRKDGSFLFTVKLYRGFTHDPSILISNDHLSIMKLFEIFQKANLLGAVLAQFPYRFHNTKDNRKYIADLKIRFPEIPLVVELRHRSWLHHAVEVFMKELGVGFCNIDQPQVSFSIPLTSVLTTSIGYVRCHGRNVKTWFGEQSTRDSRYFYRYRSDELEEIAGVVKTIAGEAQRVFVIFNNHFRGNEIFDAMDFVAMLNIGKSSWPSWWKTMSEISKSEE